MAQAQAWLWGLLVLLPVGFVLERTRATPDAAFGWNEHLPTLWPWLFGAVVIGLAVGASTWQRVRTQWWDRAVQAALAIVALAFVLVLLGWPAGRAHLGLVLALWLVGAYALGCAFGWGLRELAEVPASPVAHRALVATRGAQDFVYDGAPSPFGRPAYLSKPGRDPFFVPGTGIVDPRAAAAAAAARDAAAGIVRTPVAAPLPASSFEAPRYLSKPGRDYFYLPGAGITDPRTALASQSLWRSRLAQVSATVPLASPAPSPLSPPQAASDPADALTPAAPVAPGPVAPAPAVPSASPPVEPVVAAASIAPEGLSGSAATAPALAPALFETPVVAIAPDPIAAGAEEPAAAPPVPNQDKHPGERPPGLVAPRAAAPDRLQRIRGVGPKNEVQLNGLGIWHFAQIAEWTPAHVIWVGSYLAFPGRIERESWIEQAGVLAAGGVGAKDNPTPRPRRPRV